ncbi:type IV secretion protein Dot [uncultured Legionella sp.]|uniref:type IV secretion protein Dot n=1 Tax=uncultured Legionella sp. TaxID=210934 RepID=UPI00260F1514|nr:type IV secretion protein Dot [uncultured Legionella sp.]
MQSNAMMKFELLKILLLTPQYVTSIIETTGTQNLFLNVLKTNQYSSEELLELINITQNSQVKSLLIVYLLSIPHYLERLSEQSVLGRLTNNLLHIPSRLNPLIHQLAIEYLTIEQIDTLQPEAAVSILCSVPHFHLLKKEQIDALIDQFPHKILIQYWINHYSLQPNAFYVLAHLSKSVSSEVLSEIQLMNGQKQEELMERVLEHLDLFEPDFKLLYEGDSEQHLAQAIKHYLNGKHHEHYITYIHQLTELLLNQNHPLSLETIQLLLSLNKIEQFSELNQKTSVVINHALRIQAKSGDTKMFYTNNQLNCNRMNHPIQFKSSKPVKTEERGFLHSFLHPTKTEESQKITDKNSISENSLIDLLAKQKKLVKATDYYLLHFNGSGETLSKLIQDYLGYYLQEGCTELQRRNLYLTAILMNRSELKRSAREALYTSFLLYPELYDEQIRSWLFKYDAERTIKHFGQQAGIKNYKVVIELCTEALKKLDAKKDEATLKIANQALSEAKLELEFSENTGFFTGLFHWLIRCWKSGWTGFFSPKLPVLVAPYYEQSKEAPSRTITTVHETTIPFEKPEVTLAKSLTQLENKPTVQELDNLVKTLSAAPTLSPQDELSLRNRINNVFHRLIIDSKQDKEIASWLAQNNQLLDSNHFHLLELRLRQGNHMERDLLVKQIQEDNTAILPNNDSSRVRTTINELNCILPALHPVTQLAGEKTQTTSEMPISLETVTDMVTNAWSWAQGGVGSFFSGYASTPAKEKTPNCSLTQMHSL